MVLVACWLLVVVSILFGGFVGMWWSWNKAMKQPSNYIRFVEEMIPFFTNNQWASMNVFKRMLQFSVTGNHQERIHFLTTGSANWSCFFFCADLLGGYPSIFNTKTWIRSSRDSVIRGEPVVMLVCPSPKTLGLRFYPFQMAEHFMACKL